MSDESPPPQGCIDLDDVTQMIDSLAQKWTDRGLAVGRLQWTDDPDVRHDGPWTLDRSKIKAPTAVTLHVTGANRNGVTIRSDGSLFYWISDEHWKKTTVSQGPATAEQIAVLLRRLAWEPATGGVYGESRPPALPPEFGVHPEGMLNGYDLDPYRIYSCADNWLREEWNLIYKDPKEDEEYREELHWAAAAGDLAWMQDCLDRGLPIDGFNDNEDETPLLTALYFGQSDAFAWLVRKGANPNACDTQTMSDGSPHSWGMEPPMKTAVEQLRYADVWLMLLIGGDPHCEGDYGVTALEAAQKRQDTDGPRIAALLQRHSNPDSEDHPRRGKTQPPA